MSSEAGFDFWMDLQEEDTSGKNPEPFHTVNTKNDEDILEWLNEAYEEGIQRMRPRTNRMIRNLAQYRGIHYWSQDRGGDFRNDEGAEIDTEKIIANELYELVELRVAKMTRFKPATVPVPATNEQQDKSATEVVKAVLETISYQNDKDSLMSKAQRYAQIFGEQPILITWNKHKGHIHPQWLKDKKRFKDKKKRIKDKNGEREYHPEKPTRIGDIEYSLPLPWQIIYDFKDSPSDVEWIIHYDYEHVENVRKDYPNIRPDLIESVEKASSFDVGSLAARKLTNHVLVMRLYCRSNRFLEKGFHAVCTPNIVLEKGPLPYNRVDASEWGNLPIERLTDVDIPGVLYPVSTFQIFGNLQNTINKLYTLANRNLMLVGHPKMMVPDSANVNFEDLGNDATVVEYSGDVPPQLITGNVIGTEIFAFIGQLTEKLQALGGTHPVSTGSPPPGIKAGIAIRLLEDIENQRSTNVIKKHNNLVVALDKKTLAVVGKYYKEDDGRMTNIVGRDKTYLVDSFDASVLNRPYDIRIQQTSSLPQSPAARTQTIIDLMQVEGFRQILPDEQWADLLDLAAPGKFYTTARAAVVTAEWENEEFIQNRVPPEPREGEKLDVHWRVHATFYQQRGFLDLSDKQKEDFKDHLLTTEFLMWRHMQENPTFAQTVLALKDFPLLFKQPQPVIPTPNAQPQTGNQPPPTSLQPVPPAPEEALTVGQTPGDQALQN